MRDWFRGKPATPFMASTAWGPIAFRNSDARGRPQPDQVAWVQPSSVGRAYAGAQLHNGVSQLDAAYNVVTAGDLPYWQSQARLNPPQSTRFGGSPRTPMGPVGVRNLKAASNQAKPLTSGGYGTLYQEQSFGSYPGNTSSYGDTGRNG